MLEVFYFTVVAPVFQKSMFYIDIYIRTSVADVFLFMNKLKYREVMLTTRNPTLY